MAAKKRGHKLTNTPKEYMLRVRMDAETEKTLDVLMEERDVSKSELVRNCVLKEYHKRLKNSSNHSSTK